MSQENTNATPTTQPGVSNESEAVQRTKEFTPGEGRFRARRRKRVSYLTINKITQVDYKDVHILKRFTNEYDKIISCRQTGNTAKQQRMIASAIKKAREMALLPFVTRELVDRYNPNASRKPYEYSRYHRNENHTSAQPAQSTQESTPTTQS